MMLREIFQRNDVMLLGEKLMNLWGRVSKTQGGQDIPATLTSSLLPVRPLENAHKKLFLHNFPENRIRISCQMTK